MASRCIRRRAARCKMPLMLSIIGGNARRFRPFVDLYHRSNEQLGNGVLPVGVHSPGFITDTDEEARERHIELYGTEVIPRVRRIVEKEA